MARYQLCTPSRGRGDRAYRHRCCRRRADAKTFVPAETRPRCPAASAGRSRGSSTACGMIPLSYSHVGFVRETAQRPSEVVVLEEGPLALDAVLLAGHAVSALRRQHGGQRPEEVGRAEAAQRRGLSPWTSPYLDGDAGLDASVSRTVPRHDRSAPWPNSRDGAGLVHGCDGRVR
jgi:hypothetical protein